VILDWYCPCGLQGMAVALKAGEEALRVGISHEYHEQSRRKRERWRQNACQGGRVKYVRRTATAPKGDGHEG